MKVNCSPRLLGGLGAMVLLGSVAATGATVAHATAGLTPVVTSVQYTGSGASANTEGGQTATINGSGFTGVTSVQFGDGRFKMTTVCGTVPPPPDKGCFIFVIDSAIHVLTPSHPDGQVDVTVTTDGGSSVATSLDKFTFVAPQPAAPRLSANSGPPSTSLTVFPAFVPQEQSFFDWPTSAKFTPASGGGSVLTVPLSSANIATDLLNFQAPASGMTFNVPYDVTITTSGSTPTSPVNRPGGQFTFVAPVFHPTGVGAPDAVVQSDGSQLIFWRSSTNHLMEAWQNGFWNGPVDWTANNGWAATVDSTPSVTLGANGTQLVFWQGPGGHLFEAWVASNGWNGPIDWTANNHWAPSMSSAPSAVIQTNGVQMIFWQGGGHLFEAWVDVNGWHGPLDWTAFNHWAPSVVSAPTIHLQSDGSQLVFWQGPGNHLFEAWFTGAWHGPLDWTAFEGWAPTVTSTPSVALIGSAQAIFWQGPGGHLFEAWNDAQGWHGPLDWTTWVFHGTFPLTSAPSVVLSGQAQLIWWQGAGGHLVEAWFTGSWNGPFDWSA